MIVTLSNGAKLQTDENGEVWYLPVAGDPQLLADADSICGYGIFSTGHEDIFRDCCSFHDDAYRNRAFFEARGWNRMAIDDYFLQLMLGKAGDDLELKIAAHEYYWVARMFGGLWYYRHPKYVEGEPIVMVKSPHANMQNQISILQLQIRAIEAALNNSGLPGLKLAIT